VSALGRNTVLSLAEAELFSMRWLEEILAETERALGGTFTLYGHHISEALAAAQVNRMRSEFPDAMVEEYLRIEAR